MPRESLRAEAARRGVTVYRVRVERGAARGVSPSVAVGKPKKGERLLSSKPGRKRGGYIKPQPQLPPEVPDPVELDQSFYRKTNGKYTFFGHRKDGSRFSASLTRRQLNQLIRICREQNFPIPEEYIG